MKHRSEFHCVLQTIFCSFALLATCLSGAWSFSLQGASAPGDVYARPTTSLNGRWHYIIDRYETGYFDYRRQAYDAASRPWGGFFLDREPADKTELVEYSFDQSPTMRVPGDWNSQDERLLYYEGSVWFRRIFDDVRNDPASRLFLHFGAVNYQADVYLNGHKLGTHVGGFTPFAFEITPQLRATANSLVVRVDNQRLAEGVPTNSTDWWNYGGITRDVLLVETPATFISNYRIQLAPDDPGRVAVQVQLSGPRLQQTVRVALPEAGLEAEVRTDANGRGEATLPASGLERWSPEQPKLYAVTLAAGGDRIDDRIGFRTIETRGSEILLNGEPIFLRGISIHEENPLRGGRAFAMEDARLLLGWAKELNCNFVRLAHYPHNEHMIRLADELGLLVWEEIPVYWTIEWENPETLANARAQLSDVIDRDENRASVIIWSVANETPVSPVRTRFLKTLVDTARERDGTRLVSAAMELRTDPDNPNHKIVDDEFGQFTDLVSFNEYVGWYDGLPDKAAHVTWSIKYDKPVIISEFGAGALPGWHADNRTRFSEEFQEDVYVQTLAMLRQIPNFRGTTPWILSDFRSPRRLLPQVQDGWNRKGLIGDNGEKKKAFAVLKAFYDEMEAESARR